MIEWYTTEPARGDSSRDIFTIVGDTVHYFYNDIRSGYLSGISSKPYKNNEHIYDILICPEYDFDYYDDEKEDFIDCLFRKTRE